MTVAWFRALARWRRKPILALVLGVAAGVAGGISTAGVIGAGRTTAAFDQMVLSYLQPDAAVFLEDATSSRAELDRRLGAAPEVEAAGGVAAIALVRSDPVGPSRWIEQLAFAAMDDQAFRAIQRSL